MSRDDRVVATYPTRPGAILAGVELAKSEIPSELYLLAPDGEVDVGTTVGVIGAEGDEVSLEPPEPQPAEPSEPKETPAEEAARPAAEGEREEPAEPSDRSSQGRAVECEPSAPRGAPAAAEARGRVKASPLARRIARERGIELASLRGTGPDGRIVAEDVERGAAPSRPGPAEAPAVGEVEVVELNSIRRTIARRLTEAWEAPVFQLTVTADASELVATREQRREADGQRRADPCRRRGARAAPSRERTLRRGSDPAPLCRARRDRGRDAERARRPRYPRCRPQDGARDRECPRRSRVPGAGGKAAVAGSRGWNVHDLEPGHVRDRAVRRSTQPAAGRDPGSWRHRRPLSGR